MKKILLAAVLMVLVTGIAVAADTTAVMAPVQQFVNGFNKGDAKVLLAACADQASVIDDFPPHEWQGAQACKMWLSDYEAYAKKNGVIDGVVTLGQPRHVDVTGDRAYVVVPANFTYKKDGKPTSENGATFIVALQQAGGAWHITGWAWGAR